MKSKVVPLSKNHKDYEDVPDGLKWAVPIHECLQRPEVVEEGKNLQERAKKKVERELCSQKIKIIKI